MPVLELRGVMGYEGHVQPMRDRARARRRRRGRRWQALVDTAGLLRAAGLPCPIVSAGGTGTYDISGRVPGVTEIQAGSYALMDTDYGDVGVPFEQAFFVLGTIVSRPALDRMRADCGAQVGDQGSRACRRCEGVAGARVTAVQRRARGDGGAPRAACSRSAIACVCVPSHTDPTVNLHDVFYVVEGDRVVDVWPIAARGYPEHRQGSL